MKTEMHTDLVAIEDASLETVAGGYYGEGSGYMSGFSLDFDFNFQKNEVVFAQNTLLAGGDIDIDIDASNKNG